MSISASNNGIFSNSIFSSFIFSSSFRIADSSSRRLSICSSKIRWSSQRSSASCVRFFHTYKILENFRKILENFRKILENFRMCTISSRSTIPLSMRSSSLLCSMTINSCCACSNFDFISNKKFSVTSGAL